MVAGCRKWIVRFLWAIFWIAMVVLSYFTFPISIPFWAAFVVFWRMFRWSKLGFAPSWLRVILWLLASVGFIPVWGNVVNTTGIGNPLKIELENRQNEALTGLADAFGWDMVTNTPPAAAAQNAIQAIAATSVPPSCPSTLSVYEAGTKATVIYAGGVNVRNGPGTNYTLIETLPVNSEIAVYASTSVQFEGYFWIVLDPTCSRWITYHDGGSTVSVKIQSP